jgi:hypothetical protein
MRFELEFLDQVGVEFVFEYSFPLYGIVVQHNVFLVKVFSLAGHQEVACPHPSQVLYIRITGFFQLSE